MILPISREDKITLKGKTEFGESFVSENGSEFIVVKVQTWGEHQLLIKALKENVEIGLIWINLFPISKNFEIYKDNKKIVVD